MIRCLFFRIDLKSLIPSSIPITSIESMVVESPIMSMGSIMKAGSLRDSAIIMRPMTAAMVLGPRIFFRALVLEKSSPSP